MSTVLISGANKGKTQDIHRDTKSSNNTVKRSRSRRIYGSRLVTQSFKNHTVTNDTFNNVQIPWLSNKPPVPVPNRRDSPLNPLLKLLLTLFTSNFIPNRRALLKHAILLGKKKEGQAACDHVRGIRGKKKKNKKYPQNSTEIQNRRNY